MDAVTRADRNAGGSRRARGAHARGWALGWTRSSRVHRAPTAPSGSRFRRVRLTVAATVAAVALGGFAGSAYAYFTSTGSGSGHASVGTLKAVVVEAATGTPTSKLVPGGTADLTLTLTNPNPFTVTITGIAEFGTSVSVVGTSSCTSTNAGVSVPTETGLTTTLAHGSHVVTIATGASMSATSSSACQNASFHVPVTVTVKT